MLKTLRIMLIPNDKQKTRLFQFAGSARFAYNWALSEEEKNYNAGGKFLSDYELRKRFTVTHVKLENIAQSLKKNHQGANWFRLAEHDKIPLGVKYTNPRISFDGLNWFLTVGIEIEAPKPTAETNDGIGIDLGVKDLAICSTGHIYKNINKTRRVRRLKKKQRRLQRKISRKYEKNKKGERYQKTRNIIKSEKQLLRITHKLTDIRMNYTQHVTTGIIKREPSFIVMEDLNVSGMMKNKHLARAVQEQKLAEFYRIMSYKCSWHGIKLITADRFYASSKTCSVCGNIKKDLKLSDRTYHCEHCGAVIDRDLNASINLYQYGKSVINR